MKYEISSNGSSLECDFQVMDEQLVIATKLGKWYFDAVEIQPGIYSVLLNQRSFVVGICQDNGLKANVNGTPMMLELLDAVHLHLRDLGWDTLQETKAGLISAQIPGLITKIFHKVGDMVQEGDPLFLMEAMKMENEIKAPLSGVIQKISIRTGQTVDKGTNILEIG